MSRYRIENTVVDSERAVDRFALGGQKAGYGRIKNFLYRTRRGRWWMEHWYTWTEDSHRLDYAEWVSVAEAARLLDEAGESLPELAAKYAELTEVIEQVSE